MHFSRLWNPAREDQATDRVYRIGQKKEVHVYYPLAEHPEVASFDPYLSDVLERKRKLAESALFPALMGEIQSEDMEAFFQGSSQAEVQEAPAWLRVVRVGHEFSSLEDFLFALDQTGVSLYRLVPKIGRIRQFTLDALAGAARRNAAELFMTEMPEDAAAAIILDEHRDWVLFVRRGLSPEQEIAFAGHALMHRALGHLARKDQRGHWDRLSDLVSPVRRWDQEVMEWTSRSRAS